MKLKRATPADAGAIARVHVLAWQETYRALLPEEFLASLSIERRAALWASQLGDPALAAGITVALEGAGEVVGFASTGPCRSEGLEYEGELYAIYLLRSHHGRGVGRALFEAGARSLHEAGLRSMMLWVLKDNPTRGFYEHMGGGVFGEQPLEIGSRQYIEVGYGWPDVGAILGQGGQSSGNKAPKSSSRTSSR